MTGFALMLLLSQSSVIARPGDTWNRLALRVYGDTLYAETLRKANPDLPEPRGEIRIPEIPAFAEVLLVVGRAFRSHHPIQPGSRLQEQDTLQVDSGSRVELLLSDGSRMRVEGPAKVYVRTLRRVDPFDLRAWFHMVKGQIEIRLRRLTGLNKKVEISTPSAKGSIRGTWTSLKAGEDRTWNMVFQGKVHLANDQGSVRLNSGEGSVALRDRPPLSPRPLPASPEISSLPSVIFLGGDRGNLLLEWHHRDPLIRVHLILQTPSRRLLDTLLPHRGYLIFPITPGSLYVEWRAQDTLGLESTPIRQRVQVFPLR